MTDVALGQTSTLDAAEAITGAKPYAHRRVDETDVARSVDPARPYGLGQASEASSATVTLPRLPSPRTVTLAAGTVATVLLDRDYQAIELLNVTGTAAVWFRLDGRDPAAGASGAGVLPAAIWRTEVPDLWAGNTIIKLISSGTPMVSIRGLR